jgi:asparagine synthase (glutamine-hydrolysing)
MCGIAGIIERPGAPVEGALLGRMTDVLAHRGPDGRGTVILGPAGLGHRRLSIIDLATGDQPMTNEDHSAWVVFNGEIYNYRALRDELGSRGRRFHTTSDTEVILAAYEVWGDACLDRLRGMFAFAIWDERRRRLLLARDRLGIKPLAWTFREGRLLFGSEPKALLEDPAVPAELDCGALRDYLTLLYVPSPLTIFRGIHKLEPGTCLTFEPGGEPVVRRYWDLRFVPDRSLTEAEWLERLRALLADTVGLHLMSDVPLGAFLSGGIDSSAVVAHMAPLVAGSVRTFSIGFDEADFDELRYARQVARHLGTDHYEMVVKPDALDVLPRLAWHFDEPFADASAIPTYYVSKISREHVTVALSGDGGDECFAGYTRYARALRFHRRMDRSPLALLQPFLRRAAAALPAGLRGRGTLASLGARGLERYYRMVTYQDAATTDRLLSADARQALAAAGPFTYLADRAQGLSDHAYLSALQALDLRTYLPEDILTKVDRTSMAVSLEARVPLLDHVLVEFLAHVPAELQLAHGVSKALFKASLAGALPPDILDRPKMGFAVPLTRWFRLELKDFLRDVLLDSRARQRGLFAPAQVAALIEQHQGRTRDHTSQLWSLLVFELWARNWLDRTPNQPGGLAAR